LRGAKIKLHILLATKDEKRWIVEHSYAGIAVFVSKKDAKKHLESIRAEGVQYEIIDLATTTTPRLRK
jgi:hypothetical protein